MILEKRQYMLPKQLSFRKLLAFAFARGFQRSSLIQGNLEQWRSEEHFKCVVCLFNPHNKKTTLLGWSN